LRNKVKLASSTKPGDYEMAHPSEDIEYDDPSLKEEEPIHDDFNLGNRYR